MRFLLSFCKSLQSSAGMLPQLCHAHFLSHPFRFMFHNHPTFGAADVSLSRVTSKALLNKPRIKDNKIKLGGMLKAFWSKLAINYSSAAWQYALNPRFYTNELLIKCRFCSVLPKLYRSNEIRREQCWKINF
jgi:hypothetical protein